MVNLITNFIQLKTESAQLIIWISFMPCVMGSAACFK